jgi:hypothetical protein
VANDLAELRTYLTARVEAVAETLFGASNPALSTRHQLRFGSRGSLCIELRKKRGSWFSHEAGVGGGVLDLVGFAQSCSFPEAVTWASEWSGAIATSKREAPISSRPPVVGIPSRHSGWWALWSEAKAPAGTPTEVYLANRGCAGPAPAALRFHPACPRGNGERLPAMLALMTDPAANRPIGVHRTFLRPDGRGKVLHGNAKMMLGQAGVIRLVPDDAVTLGLGICEGIETGLSLVQRAGWQPIWAVGSAGGIARFPVLAGIEALTIFPDRDDAGASARAADECAARWLDKGREVRKIWPLAGHDWNDCLAKDVA